MSKEQLEFSGSEGVTMKRMKIRLLSDLKMHDVYKYTVPSSDWISQINKSLNKANFGKGEATDYVFENHIQYMDRILIDEPDYFLKHPNTDDLTFFAFDIETLRENYVDKKKIISIAYSYHNGTEWEDIKTSQATDENEAAKVFDYLNQISSNDHEDVNR